MAASRTQSTQSTSFPSLVVTWSDRLMLASIHLLVLITPFLFTWVNDELFEFNKMLFTYALVILAIGALAAKTIVLKKWLIPRTIFDIPLLLFLGSQAMSTLFSIHPYTSLWGYYSRFNGGLISLVAYTALYFVVVHSVQRKHLAALTISLVIGLLGSSLYAFPEHFGFSPSCILIAGEMNATCWLQDVQHRVFGTFGQPNWLAAYIVTLLPLTLLLPFIAKKIGITEKIERVLQISALTTAAIAYPTLLFTKSRSGILGLGVALVCMAIGMSIVALRSKAGHKYRQFVTLGLGLLSYLLIITLIFGTPYTPSLGQLQKSDSQTGVQTEVSKSSQEVPTAPTNRLDVGGTDSGEIRKIVWDGSIAVWKRYPFFGSGVETFAYSYYLDRPMTHNLVSEWDFLYNKAHNELLNFAATTGTVGLISYIIIYIWFGVRVAWYILTTDPKKEPHYPETALLLTAITSGLIGLSISNFFGFSTVMVMILTYLFLAITHILLSKKSPESLKSPKQLSLVQNLLLGLVAITTAWLLLSTINRWQADYLYTQGKDLAQSGYLQDSLPYLTRSITLQPREALFYDELANVYARLAYSYSVSISESKLETAQKIDEQTLNQAEEQVLVLAQASIDASDTALALNPVHLNFYKTRARIFLLLSELNESYLQEAYNALEAASYRAPTDPKLIYNLGLVSLAQGNVEMATKQIEQSITMKPNYEAARMKLAEIYQSTNQPKKAIEQYQYVLDTIAPENEIAQQNLEKLHREVK